jgi:hypothetical protein
MNADPQPCKKRKYSFVHLKGLAMVCLLFIVYKKEKMYWDKKNSTATPTSNLIF